MDSVINSPHWTWLWLVVFATFFALIAANFILLRRRARLRLAGKMIPAAIPPTTVQELIPDSKYVSVNGANLHYVQAGDALGGDVVLLHGIGASVYIWRFLFPILQTRRRVTAFDFLGFGKSSKDPKLKYDLDAQSESIASALTEIGIAKASLVGSSMGGAIALWMAKRWPDRFEYVAALGPATDSSLVPGLAQHFAATAPLFRHTVNRRSIKLILGYVVANKKLITDQVVERYLEPFRDRGESLRAFVAATAVLSDRRLPNELKDLTSDALVIWGANDYLVSRKSMTKLANVLATATFIYHPTGGHHIMEDEPVWLARKLELFFSGDDVSDDSTPESRISSDATSV